MRLLGRFFRPLKVLKSVRMDMEGGRTPEVARIVAEERHRGDCRLRLFHRIRMFMVNLRCGVKMRSCRRCCVGVDA